MAARTYRDAGPLRKRKRVTRNVPSVTRRTPRKTQASDISGVSPDHASAVMVRESKKRAVEGVLSGHNADTTDLSWTSSCPLDRLVVTQKKRSQKSSMAASPRAARTAPSMEAPEKKERSGRVASVMRWRGEPWRWGWEGTGEK